MVIVRFIVGLIVAAFVMASHDGTSRLSLGFSQAAAQGQPAPPGGPPGGGGFAGSGSSGPWIVGIASASVLSVILRAACVSNAKHRELTDHEAWQAIGLPFLWLIEGCDERRARSH